MNKLLRVALVWNGTVMEERTLGRGKSFGVGARSGGFEIPVGDDTTTSAELFAAAGDGYTVQLSKGMSARISVSNAEKDYTAPATVNVKAGDWGVIHIGDAAIYFQFIDDDAAIVAPGAGRLQPALINSFLLSAFPHLIFLLFVFSALPPLKSAGDFRIDDRFARILAEMPPDTIEDLVEEEMPEDESTSKAAGGEEGRFGAEDAPVEDSVLPDYDGPLVDRIDTPELGRAMDAAIGMSGALSNVFGSSDSFSNQFGADFATAGTGDAFVLGQGSGGLGFRGTGRGGGGDGLGRVQGVGGIDTGSGRGQGARLGNRGEVQRRATVGRGTPQVAGFLSREQIERVVRRHTRGIQFCYERELQNDANLAGRIAVQWTIGMDGRVQSASATENTMGNRNVESCVVAEVRRMRFDQPDGGNVVVTYPFTFRSGS